MKKDYKVIGFNFTPELNKQLQEICIDTKMNRSEVVRQLIQKAYIDKKTREIITRNSYWEKAKRKMEGDTSHNVHCVNEEKNPANHMTERVSVSEEHQLDYSQLDYYVKEGVEAIANAEKDQEQWNRFFDKVKYMKECPKIMEAINDEIKKLQQEYGQFWKEAVNPTSIEGAIAWARRELGIND